MKFKSILKTLEINKNMIKEVNAFLLETLSKKILSMCYTVIIMEISKKCSAVTFS